MAKKFIFRPEVILKLREQREDLTLRKLAVAQGRVSEMQESIRRIRQQMSEQDAMVRSGMLTGSVDVQYMSLYRRHVMALHRMMIQNVQELQVAAGELHKVQAEVLQAVKERKVMSRLKEKLHERYQAGIERLERREMDDMTTMRFGYQRQGGQE